MNKIPLYYGIYAELRNKIRHKDRKIPATVMVTTDNIIIAKSPTCLHENVISIWANNPDAIHVTFHSNGDVDKIEMSKMTIIDICNPNMIELIFEALEIYGYTSV